MRKVRGRLVSRKRGVQDVHEGRLAHELGHAVIGHYLSVRPPCATAEITAKYVDKHLFEELRKY